MLCLKSMAMGESIDLQRNTRWPGQTSSTEARVIWDPYQEDELREDTEAILDEAMNVDSSGNGAYEDRE
jgi:hypothetical protein